MFHHYIMIDINEIIDKLTVINCGFLGCGFKFEYKDKMYCIKIIYNNTVDDINTYEKFKLNNKFSPKALTINKKYIYDENEAEIKVYKLISEVVLKETNNNSINITPKFIQSGIIKDKVNVNKLKNKLKSMKNVKSDVNKNTYFRYYITEYVNSIQLDECKYISSYEYHIYFTYIVLYLIQIKKKYDFAHNDLHGRNVLLVEDEYYKLKKFRYIKVNNDVYKMPVLRYRPLIIDFGFSNIYNKNIINNNLNLSREFALIPYKDGIRTNKNLMITNNVDLLINKLFSLSGFDINDVILYCKRRKYNKLIKLFNYIKEVGNMAQNMLKFKNKLYMADSNVYDIVHRCNDETIIKYIEYFKQ